MSFGRSEPEDCARAHPSPFHLVPPGEEKILNFTILLSPKLNLTMDTGSPLSRLCRNYERQKFFDN